MILSIVCMCGGREFTYICCLCLPIYPPPLSLSFRLYFSNYLYLFLYLGMFNVCVCVYTRCYIYTTYCKSYCIMCIHRSNIYIYMIFKLYTYLCIYMYIHIYYLCSILYIYIIYVYKYMYIYIIVLCVYTQLIL